MTAPNLQKPLSSEAETVFRHVATKLAGEALPSYRDLGRAIERSTGDRFGPSTVKRILDRLEARGFIFREELANLEGASRRSLLSVTAAGREALAALDAGAPVIAADSAARAVAAEAEAAALAESLRVPAAANGVPATPAAMTALTLVMLDEIAESPLNPRRTFDPDALAELADSIASQGLLQPLTVRPLSPSPDAHTPYELVFGARRLRALRLLADAGRLPDPRVPVQVRAIADDDALLAQIVENTQRADVHPLEEGEALAAFLARHPDTRVLAREIGRSRRWVQERVALVRRLAPPVKDAFQAGKIALADAKVLKTLPEERQVAVLDDVVAREWGYETAEALAETVSDERLPLLGDALFDPTLYHGELLDETEDGGALHCVDADQFRRLQAAAVEARRAALAERYDWVEVLPDQKYHDWLYRPDATGQDTGAVIVLHDSGRVEVHEGLARADGPGRTAAPKAKGKGKAAAAPAPRRDSEQVTAKHAIYAARAKTIALQLAVARHTHVAMAAVVVGLLTSSGVEHQVKLRRAEIHADDVTPGENEALQASLDEMLAPAAAAGLIKPPKHRYDVPKIDEAGLLRWLLTDGFDRLDQIFAAVVARCVGTWASHAPSFGDGPLALEMAAEAQAGPTAWPLDREYLELLRLSRLKAIARACGIPADELAGAPKKRADLIAWIAEHPWRQKAYLPPELQWADKAAIDRMIDAEAEAAS